MDIPFWQEVLTAAMCAAYYLLGRAHGAKRVTRRGSVAVSPREPLKRASREDIARLLSPTREDC